MQGKQNLHNGFLLGAIIGDICGSIYEFKDRKFTNPTEIDLVNLRCHFTDDTVLTIATAEVLLQKRDYTEAYKDWGCRYLHAGFGGTYWKWMQSDDLEPYNSWGNGSAMRVSPVGWFFETLEETLAEAKRSAEVTHNHPEGIKGAESVAAAIFLARNGKTKQEIKEYVESTFGYDLNRTTDQIRPDYKFDVSCMGSVPEAIICFLESNDYAHALQLAISIGGDTDTIACITGGIAEAFYREIPDELVRLANVKLTGEMMQVVDAFQGYIRISR
jgi:ADP-ribosylglycohydrolase